MNRWMESLLASYKNRGHKERPYLVALDGLSGAGKTSIIHTIKKELSPHVPIVTVHIDDHIVERKDRYHTGQEEWYEYYFLQWDVKNLEHHLFRALHQSEERVLLPFYDHHNDSISYTDVQVPTNSLLLIEGVFLQRVEWKSYFDWIVFLDCPREVRYARVLERDQYIGDYQARLAKYTRRYWPAEEYYLREVNPIRHANMVVNN